MAVRVPRTGLKCRSGKIVTENARIVNLRHGQRTSPRDRSSRQNKAAPKGGLGQRLVMREPAQSAVISYTVVVPLTSLPTTSSGAPFGESSALMNTSPSGPRSPAAGVSTSSTEKSRLFT